MKGKLFEGIDDPLLPRQVRLQDEETRTAWVEAYNARFATVEECPDCGRELCAEEVTPHRLNHLPPRARVLGRMFEDADEPTQAALLGYLRQHHPD